MPNYDSDSSEYNEDDFRELLSKEEIEDNMNEFFDNVQEMFNPADDQRLQLDTIVNCKKIVTSFYSRKESLCLDLLSTLDKMNTERPYLLALKKQELNHCTDNSKTESLTGVMK